MHDMHVHLGFMENGQEVAADALADGTLLFANTVTPDEWRRVSSAFEDYGNVVVGFGMHPWWVDGAWEIEEELVRANPDVVGEIGLDFGRRHAETRDLQGSTFRTIARWTAKQGEKVLSIHSVHAAKEALDILDETGALEGCTCIFHWFTGPSDQLKRAIQAGCLFSVGPRMLATGKGREYVKAIPARQLLLETDAPPEQGQRYSYSELRDDLQATAEAIAAIKGPDALEDVWEAGRRVFPR